MADGSVEISAGTVVGGAYIVLRHLSSGAGGNVYVAEEVGSGRERALKTLAAELVTNDKARERFSLEARVGRQIDNEHVVDVVADGVDEATGVPYLVMERLHGEDLGARIASRGALSYEELAPMYAQCGEALAAAHAKGIVHRDIKPENLFVAKPRRAGVPFTVKVLDFGIAKLVDDLGGPGTQPVGTLLYMAPEQTDRRGRIGPHTDVWALGLVAFHALTGKSYWRNAKRGGTNLMREVLSDELCPASERARELETSRPLPVGFDAWFARCVDRDPDRRFPDAGECVAAFAKLAPTGDAIPSAPTSVALELAPESAPKSRVGLIIGVSVALFLVAIVAYFMARA